MDSVGDETDKGQTGSLTGWSSLGPEKETRIWSEGHKITEFLLIGWCWGNKVVFQEPCTQPEVTILHQVGDPSSAGELKDTVKHIPWVEIRTLSQGCTTTWLLLPCFHFLPSRISNCLNLPFGTQRRSRRLIEAYILQTRNRGHK